MSFNFSQEHTNIIDEYERGSIDEKEFRDQVRKLTDMEVVSKFDKISLYLGEV